MRDRPSAESDPVVEMLGEGVVAVRSAAGGCLGLALTLGLATAAIVCLGVAAMLFFFYEPGWWKPLGIAVGLALAAWVVHDRSRATLAEPPDHGRRRGLRAFRDSEQARGRISGLGRAATLVQLWAAGLITVPVLVATVFAFRVEGTEPWLRWTLVAVAVMGINFSIGSIRAHRRAMRSGPSSLVIDELPVRVGGGFTGHIEIGFGAELEEVGLELVCQRVIRSEYSLGRAGQHHGDELERLVVLQQQVLPAHVTREVGGRWRVPVRFGIPADAPPTDLSNPRDQVNWALRLTGRLVTGAEEKDYWEVRVHPPGPEPVPADDRQGPGALR